MRPGPGTRIGLLALFLAGIPSTSGLDAQVPADGSAVGLGIVPTRVAQAWSAGDLGAVRSLFAHLRWSTVPRGTSEPVSYTLFVGMVHGEPGWRIYEIRVLR